MDFHYIINKDFFFKLIKREIFNLNININIMEVKRYKAGTLKGELTTAEIKKLIRAHNKASSIKIPPKSSRENIVGILQKAGYSVNHEKAELRPVSKGKVQKLKVISQKTIAEELPKPKPLTEEQKKKRQQAKQKKAGEKAFLKASIPKPPPVSKPSKGVKVGKPPPKKSKKEDEVRPARQPAPPIPKAKDFVKIGGRPSGKKVDTDGSRNVGKVDTSKPKKPKKTEEEKQANREKVKRADDLYRLKISELRNYVDMYNERDDKEMTLKSKGQDKDQLVNKIVGYNIDKIFKIPIPAKRVKQTEEQKIVKKKQDSEKLKQERKNRKPFLSYLKLFNELQRKYNVETKKQKYANVEEVIEKMKEQLAEKLDEIEEDADEKDIELDDEVYDEIETDIDNYYKALREKADEENEK
jgi:hypothetical protein